ncbi:hypothetical protein MAR_007721 [Mya arenaria]|uniref:Uncharacterized protein n=1 Tax=Mya arenaria TaxID=6604 RepID=A0ABY7DWZ4_MYAAR|nr:hypothetical protein MAR_007721 [Mya arenaria]
MEFLFQGFSVLIFFLDKGYSEFTDWTTLLLLKPGSTVSPVDVWSDVSSSYNSDVNMTFSALVASGSQGYRNRPVVDNWASYAPDRVRVSYRNGEGFVLFSAIFNATGSSDTDWLAMSHLVGNHAYSQVTWSTDYISYGVQLAFTDSSWGVERYSAAAVRLPDGTYVYVVPFSGTLDLLPMTLLDVNTKVFDAPLSDGTSITVSEAIEVSFIARQVIYGFNVSVTSPLVSDVSVELVLHFRNEACNGTNLLNKTHQETFIIPPSPGGFITADYLVIETSWEIASGELCECECWVYDLLYGDSPFTNLSYTEIEKALENVTKQIEKELSVNRSELSSTIRKLTSAEDNRTSAVAVGYTLGVAMLTCIFGAIILADLPRIYEGFKTLRHNLRSRFYPETTVNNVSMERIPSLPQPDD